MTKPMLDAEALKAGRPHAGRLRALADVIVLGDHARFGPEQVEWLREAAAYLSRARPAEGWRLVPVEPTHEMILALYGPWLSVGAHGSRLQGYAEMLAAAPRGEEG